MPYSASTANRRSPNWSFSRRLSVKTQIPLQLRQIKFKQPLSKYSCDSCCGWKRLIIVYLQLSPLPDHKRYYYDTTRSTSYMPAFERSSFSRCYQERQQCLAHKLPEKINSLKQPFLIFFGTNMNHNIVQIL